MYNNRNKKTLSPNERLIKAAGLGDLEDVKKAIGDGASLNHNFNTSVSNDWSPYKADNNPLISAAQNGHEEVVKFFLEKNIRVDGSLLREIMRKKCDHNIVYLLIEKIGFYIFYLDDGRSTEKELKDSLISLSFRKHNQLIKEVNEKAEDRNTQLNEIKGLLEQQNLAIAQLQSKNDLIVHQNEIIFQLNQSNLALKDELAKLQEQIKSLSDDKTLTIEINDHERQLQELKQEVINLKEQLSKSKFKDKPHNAVTMQALARGFLSRKHHSLASLKEQRKAEIQLKLPETMSRLAASGKYEEITKLAEAMKHEKLHQAIQIVRGKSEQEISVESRRVKY